MALLLTVLVLNMVDVNTYAGEADWSHPITSLDFTTGNKVFISQVRIE